MSTPNEKIEPAQMFSTGSQLALEKASDSSKGLAKNRYVVVLVKWLLKSASARWEQIRD